MPPSSKSLYRQYLDNPDAVDPSWRAFFAELGEQELGATQLGRGPAWKRDAKIRLENGELVSALTGQWQPKANGAVSEQDFRAAAQESIRAIQLVRAYRVIGHLAADLDPLGLAEKPHLAQLEPSFYGFHEADLDKPIYMDGVLGLSNATPRQVVDILKRTYCGRIGYEFMHINDPEQKDWLQRRIEGPDKEITFTPEGKKAILNKLIEAEGFEKFCGVRFLGTKRFGLDGGEAMVPALEQIIKRGGQLGVKEIVLGMSHRGRLNVLANVMAKPYRQIFHEFQGGSAKPARGAGLRRREIPSRRLVGPRVRRQQGASVADGQPVASRSRRSGRARQGPRQAAAAGRQDRRAPACCRCCSMAMRPLPARASWPNASPCRAPRASAPAARSTSSSTTRSASPRRRSIRAPRPTRPTSR